MLARLSEGLGLCGRLNHHSSLAPVPKRACLQATLLIAVFINQNYASKLRRKRRDKQTSALISLNIMLILIIIISIIFIRNSIRCSDVRTVQGRVDCGWRKCC